LLNVLFAFQIEETWGVQDPPIEKNSTQIPFKHKFDLTKIFIVLATTLLQLPEVKKVTQHLHKML
jgi:hypothetical protein